MEPIHPGEIPFEEFMKPLGLGINALAWDLHAPPNRIRCVVHGRRTITADTALRPATYFGASAELWLSLQSQYDLRQERRTLGPEIERSVRKSRAA